MNHTCERGFRDLRHCDQFPPYGHDELGRAQGVRHEPPVSRLPPSDRVRGTPMLELAQPVKLG